LYFADLAFVHDTGFGDLAVQTAPEIVRLLRAHRIRGGTIVELGCGSGITARHLTDAGFDIIGIDASKAMIEMARRTAPQARFRVASIAAARLPHCRAAVAVGEVLSYLPGGLPALGRLFARIHAALEPRGLLLFDFIESAARRTYRVRSRGGRGWAIASSAIFDRSRRILTRRIIVLRRVGRRFRRSAEIHRVRIYSRREIRNALARAGFEVRLARSYHRYRLPPGDVVVIATRAVRRGAGAIGRAQTVGARI
jgi:SAM-dependent methyltransferase